MSYKSLHFPKLHRRGNYSAFRRYKDFRQEIRVDCQGRCIYCDAHENEIGGEKYMTLDHFKPKDKYIELKHDPTNLVWSCTVCNGLKQNMWPAYGTFHTAVDGRGFIDPFKESMWNYFDVLPNGELYPLQPPAQWMINNLELNRNGAKKIREIRNQKYERRQMFETFFNLAMKDIETLMDNANLSKEEMQRLHRHKEMLEKQYAVMLEGCELDFSLY